MLLWIFFRVDYERFLFLFVNYVWFSSISSASFDNFVRDLYLSIQQIDDSKPKQKKEKTIAMRWRRY